MQKFLKNEWTTFVGALLASLMTAILISAHANAVLTFVVSARGIGNTGNCGGSCHRATRQLHGIWCDGRSAIRYWKFARIVREFLCLTGGPGDGGAIGFGGIDPGEQFVGVGTGVFPGRLETWHTKISFRIAACHCHVDGAGDLGDGHADARTFAAHACLGT